MKLGLSVENIRKEYVGREVLKACTFTFGNGGIYILTGQNGSGKSTFLRICSLLEEPDSGQVIYSSEGGSLSKDIWLQRRITMVLPKAGIFNTTVFNNAAYGLRIRGASRTMIREKVCQTLEAFGLIDKINQNALTLSSGEMQRLGIARALIAEPEIIFLDEPTASVDQKNAEIIEELVLGMKNNGALTVIMTTHDSKQAERLADTLLLMEDGSLRPV